MSRMMSSRFMTSKYRSAARATSLQTPLAVRDGGDVEDGIRLGQCVVAGVIPEEAFMMLRLSKRARRAVAKRRRVNVGFDDEVGIGQRDFQFGQNVFTARPTWKTLSANSVKSFQPKPCSRPVKTRFNRWLSERKIYSEVISAAQ